MKNKQSGLSLISTLIVGAFLAFFLLLGFRSVPAITEYMSIQRILPLVAEEGDNGASMSQMRSSFNRRAQIDNIESIGGDDLIITKEGGRVRIEVAYDRTVPIAGNVSLLIAFDASSAN
jgi:hypothetical protein